MMDLPPLVSVIVLNWNGIHDTIECIQSVLCSDYPNIQVIVVDNGSTDNTVQYIRENFQNIILIENKTNVGFADGNNIGIKQAISQKADYVFLLNNDTIVAENTISTLIRVAQRTDNLGVLGVRILFYNEPQRIQSCGVKLLYDNPRMGTLLYENFLDQDVSITEPIEVDHLIGCSILISTKTINRIGMFDSRFFAYWEDTDLCLRAKENNLINLCETNARIWHKISASTNKGSHPSIYYYMTRNRILFIKKHSGFKDSLILQILFKDLYHVFLSGYWLKFTAIAAIINGLFDAYTHTYGPPPKWLSTPKSKFIEMKLRSRIQSIKQTFRLFRGNN